jgi:N4-gp56 family major capsid protein
MSLMIYEGLDKKLRATQFYKIDRTLTGRAGDTITVPYYHYTGPARDLPENEQGEVDELMTSYKQYTVKKAVKNFNLTDESVLSGHGDPMGHAVTHLHDSIYDKMEIDGIEALDDIDSANGHVHTISGNIEYGDIIDALDLMPKDNEEQGINATLLIHNSTAKVLRQNPRWIERQSMLGDNILASGVVGSIAGCAVVISKRVPETRSYILTPECMTAFMKRDINVETERQMLWKRTLVGSDCHYVVAIEDYDKIVAIEHPAQTI